jgi:hypothetical protein
MSSSVNPQKEQMIFQAIQGIANQEMAMKGIPRDQAIDNAYVSVEVMLQKARELAIKYDSE